MKKNKVSSKSLLLSVSFLSGLGLLMAAQSAADHFFSHPAFLVREVEVRWPEGVSAQPTRFRLQPAVSVFSVELGALSRAFRQLYPTADVERVDRILPNRVVAVLHPRQVVAQLFTGRKYIPVSDDGHVIGRSSSRPFPALPVLLLERVSEPLALGQDLDPFGFWKASELLATFHRDHGVAGLGAAKLTVRGQDLFVDLENGCQLRFGSDRLGDGWRQLWELIVRRRDLLNQVQYVDLRYPDPVIGEKNKKAKTRR